MYLNRYPSRSIFREMAKLQRDMNRLFNSNLSSASRSINNASYPATNIWMADEDIIITAELPGFKPEDLDISIMNDTITLSGSREADQLPEGGRYHRQECACGKFARTLKLPFMVDAEKVEANIVNGVLHVKLTRAEADKPKKISVKSN